MSRTATTRRTRLALVLSTAALAGATTAVIQAPSYAAETTCQGKPVTIASDARQVTGTEGPDVISAGPATYAIDALGGDDTICFYAGASVSAGAGDDHVLATTTDSRYSVAQVNLGPGDDTYTGTDGVDYVDRFAVGDADRAGTDTISTGGGDDLVASGLEGEPNRDRIDLGPGGDNLDLTLPPGSDASMVGGSGYDVVTVQSATADGRWTYDLSTTGSVQRDGRQLSSLTGVERTLAAITSPGAVVVRGDGAGQYFQLESTTPRLDVALGGGPDVLILLRTAQPGDRGRIDLGGDDGDTLTVADTHRVRVDLAKHVMTLGTDGAARYTLLGTRDVSAGAVRVRVDGDRRDNTIRLTGCRQHARGGSGDDRIYSYDGSGDAGLSCAGFGLHRRGAHLDGQRGDDRLVGSFRPGDVLVGGPGHDRADGGARRDTCRAEVEKNCER